MGQSKQKQPGTDLASILAGYIQTALGHPPAGQPFTGTPAPGSLGQMFQNVFQLPAYQGQVAAPLTAAQSTPMDYLTQWFGNGGVGGGQGALDTLAQMANNPSTGGFADILGPLANSGTLATVAQGLAQNANVQTPERALLTALAMGNPTGPAASTIGQGVNAASSLMSNPAVMQMLTGGSPGTSLSDIGAALEKQRQLSLANDQNNLREQMSGMGLRFSTPLAQASSNLSAQSEANMGAQLAQIAPQLAQTKSTTQLGALNQLSQLAGQFGQFGSQLGTLGLGGQSNATQALSQAGTLGLGGTQTGTQALQALGASGLNASQLLQQAWQTGQGNALQAALGLPGATATLGMLPYQQGSALFGMGAGAQSAEQTGLNNAYQAWLNQNQWLNMLPGLITGSPITYGPSGLSQIIGGAGNTAVTALAAATGAKKLKGK